MQRVAQQPRSVSRPSRNNGVDDDGAPAPQPLDVRVTIDVYGHLLPHTHDAVTEGLQAAFATSRGLHAAQSESDAPQESVCAGQEVAVRDLNPRLLRRDRSRSGYVACLDASAMGVDLRNR